MGPIYQCDSPRTKVRHLEKQQHALTAAANGSESTPSEPTTTPPSVGNAEAEEVSKLNHYDP